MKIGILQSPVSANKEENLQTASNGIREAARQGADLVILSEMFLCPYENESFVRNAETADGPAVQALAMAAKENSVYLVGGSIPLREGDCLYNASFVFDREGQILTVHKKVHLFDIDVDGGQSFHESETFTGGDQITVFDTEFGRMGLCICFDFRFPEQAMLMALKGARVIFCPAAFNMTTGPMHWELMFRSRAVDNQVFTVGCAPARGESGYRSWGHSIAVSPWGKVLYCADEKTSLGIVELDLAETASVRRQLPFLSARRTDLYELKERN